MKKINNLPENICQTTSRNQIIVNEFSHARCKKETSFFCLKYKWTVSVWKMVSRIVLKIISFLDGVKDNWSV